MVLGRDRKDSNATGQVAEVIRSSRLIARAFPEVGHARQHSKCWDAAARDRHYLKKHRGLRRLQQLPRANNFRMQNPPYPSIDVLCGSL